MSAVPGSTQTINNPAPGGSAGNSPGAKNSLGAKNSPGAGNSPGANNSRSASNNPSLSNNSGATANPQINNPSPATTQPANTTIAQTPHSPSNPANSPGTLLSPAALQLLSSTDLTTPKSPADQNSVLSRLFAGLLNHSRGADKANALNPAGAQTSQLSPALQKALGLNLQLSNLAGPQKQLVQVQANLGNNLLSLKVLATGQQLQIQSTENLKPGQLVVISEHKGQLRLETQSREAATQVLKRLLPHQGSIKEASNELLNSLQTAQNNGGSGTRSPEQLLGLFPRLGTLNPGHIKQLFQLLGISHAPQNAAQESATPAAGVLANPGAITAAKLGLSAALLPLAKQWLNASSQDTDTKSIQLPPMLSRLVARMVLNQFKLDGDEASELRRSELLMRHDQQLENAHIEITPPKNLAIKEREADGQNEAESTAAERQWRVRLNFEFDHLGVFTIFLILSQGRLQVQLWSDRPSTFQLIQGRQAYFRKRLLKRMQAEGIEHLEMDLFEGKAPETKTEISSQLVSEMA